jgi:hypothetical protein
MKPEGAQGEKQFVIGTIFIVPESKNWLEVAIQRKNHSSERC